MAEGAQPQIRYPLVLLCIADLALLAIRLRPWQKIASLPGKGNAAFDPGICLVVYLVVILWLTGRTGSRLVSAQAAATWIGLLSGGLLATRAWLAGAPTAGNSGGLQMALLFAAAAGWGVAGIVACREAGLVGASLITGMWSAMVSTMLACAAVLGEVFVTGPPPETQDSYKQFQEIGIGDRSTVVLVHSLASATALLLIAPFVAGILAMIFGWLGRKRAA